jgi:hypothetical protein
VLSLVRLFGVKNIRAALSRMYSRVSSSRLSGRAGREGGGPGGFVNGILMVFSGVGRLSTCETSLGREMKELTPWEFPESERELRAERVISSGE